MKCKDCAEGKRYAAGSVFCKQYGMIIREEHECIREGARIRERERAADPVGDSENEHRFPGDGWPDFDSMPEFLREE